MTKYNGKKWCVGVRERYFSGSWDMNTFRECVNYIHDQYRKQAKAGMLDDFWYWIDGPGGRMEYQTIRVFIEKGI